MAEVKNDLFHAAVANDADAPPPSAVPSFEESYANAAAVPQEPSGPFVAVPLHSPHPSPPQSFPYPQQPLPYPPHQQPYGWPQPPPVGYDPVQPAVADPPPQRTRACWKLAFWRQFFDVNTPDVTLRAIAALNPFHPPPYLEHKNYSLLASEPPVAAPECLDSPDKNREPDMYGPVWISATLWVVMAVVSHVTYAHNCPDGASTSGHELDCQGGWFGVVGVAFWVIFGYNLGIPTALWAVLRWKGAPTRLLELLCLYGYTTLPFIAASVLCGLPFNVVRWIAVLLAWLLSLTGIVVNIGNVWRHHLGGRWLLATALGVVLCHAGLALSFKLKLFSSLSDLS